MPDNPWPAIDPQRWRDVPHLRGRLATPEDIAQGKALFHLDPQHRTARPAGLELPCCGLQRLDDGTLRPVVVVQAETLGDQTILGVRYLPGGGSVCALEEVQLVEGPEGWLPAPERGEDPGEG